MLQLNPCRLNLTREYVIKILVWIAEVVVLQCFQASNFVEPYYSSLVKCDKELST